MVSPRKRHARQRPAHISRASRRREDGFALIEVVVSAALVIMIAAGALAGLESSARSSAEERHRAQAHGVAQEDQARLRALKISQLSNLSQTRTVVVDGDTYTVDSRADFVTDQTGTASCTPGTASADYVRVSSTVRWPSIGSRPPVTVNGIVTPTTGAIGEDRGALAVAVQGAAGQGMSGVGIAGSGPGSFGSTTSNEGCIIFGNLAAGNYTLTPSGSNLVDKDGNPPSPQSASVVAQSTNSVTLQLDRPGSLAVSFRTRVGSQLVPSSAESVMVFNTGMTTARAYGTPGTRQATVTATPLFPFTSPDTVYAGSCTANQPTAGSAAIGSAPVPAGGTAALTIQLPALHVNVWSGTSSSNPGVRVQGAQVMITDRLCPATGPRVRQTYLTNSAGQLPDPGLPWSRYDVCVDIGPRVRRSTNVAVQNLTSGTTLDFYMGGGSSGDCP